MIFFCPFRLAFSGFYYIFTQFIVVLECSTHVSQCKVAKDFAKMQEKEQKISPIKQRILQFADNLNISKREFYAKIGVSRGTLEQRRVLLKMYWRNLLQHSLTCRLNG